MGGRPRRLPAVPGLRGGRAAARRGLVRRDPLRAWTGSRLALEEADLFVSIGTSGAVYPAAGFVQYALAHGARTLELNLQPSEVSLLFHESRQGLAGELVPAWVEEFARDLSSPAAG